MAVGAYATSPTVEYETTQTPVYITVLLFREIQNVKDFLA